MDTIAIVSVSLGFGFLFNCIFSFHLYRIISHLEDKMDTVEQIMWSRHQINQIVNPLYAVPITDDPSVADVS